VQLANIGVLRRNPYALGQPRADDVDLCVGEPIRCGLVRTIVDALDRP
jgi:hypothetical protein